MAHEASSLSQMLDTHPCSQTIAAFLRFSPCSAECCLPPLRRRRYPESWSWSNKQQNHEWSPVTGRPRTCNHVALCVKQPAWTVPQTAGLPNSSRNSCRSCSLLNPRIPSDDTVGPSHSSLGSSPSRSLAVYTCLLVIVKLMTWLLLVWWPHSSSCCGCLWRL